MRLLALRCGGGGAKGYIGIRGGGGSGPGVAGSGRYILPWARRSSPGPPTGSLLLLRSLRTRSLKVPGGSAAVLPRLTHGRSFSVSPSYSTFNNPLQVVQGANTTLVRSSARRPLFCSPAKLASTQQQRDHGGHSHGHHHHHDNTYLTSKNKSDAGVRITRLGLYTNVGMAISKGIGGWYFNSQALVRNPREREEKERAKLTYFP